MVSHGLCDRLQGWKWIGVLFITYDFAYVCLFFQVAKQVSCPVLVISLQHDEGSL